MTKNAWAIIDSKTKSILHYDQYFQDILMIYDSFHQARRVINAGNKYNFGCEIKKIKLLI